MGWLAPAHHDELLAQWQALGAQLACAGEDWQRAGRRLIRSWARWPRRYHNTPHLLACLRHFESVRERVRNPQAVALALWFHDAIYWPWSGHNEQRSADWAQAFLSRMKLDQALIDEVVALIMTTRHQAVPAPGDAQWVVDIDLAILGQRAEVYRQFELDVRSEYRWIRWSRYTERRAAVLGGFLARERIYSTPWFGERLEAPARQNLQAAIAALRRGQLYGDAAP